MNKSLIQVVVVAVLVVIVAWFLWMRLSPQAAKNENPKGITPMQTPVASNSRQSAPAKAAAGGGETETPINEAKWSEARAAAGTIGTAIRAYCAEVGPDGKLPRDIGALGLTPQDLDGVYFGPADYTFSIASMNPLMFTVTVTPGSKTTAPQYPAKRTLDSSGSWRSEK